MLAERKKKDSRCKDTVVKREKIAVVTRGTMIDRVMVESCPDASHLLAISEFRKNEDGAMHFMQSLRGRMCGGEVCSRRV